MPSLIREWETHIASRGNVYEVTWLRKPAKKLQGYDEEFLNALDFQDYVAITDFRSLSDHVCVTRIVILENITLNRPLKTLTIDDGERGKVSYIPQVVNYMFKEGGAKLLTIEAVDSVSDRAKQVVGSARNVVSDGATSVAKSAGQVANASVDAVTGVIRGVGFTGYALPIFIGAAIFFIAKNLPAIVKAVK